MNDTARNKLKDEILTILKTSDELLQTFRKQIENKNVIIFVGNTRNGKSTLVNYITNVPLIAFKENGHYKIERQNMESDGPIIGHGTLSHTTTPTVLEMNEGGDTLIIDAPGFDDNRGVVQEIINALYINQIKYAKGVRFVLVSDINNIIMDNINYFLSFIETVHTIMPDLVKLKDAVSIIFTKDYRDYDQISIAKLLQQKILNEKEMQCRKDLIQHFVERIDLIGSFKMPTAPGPLTNEIDLNVHGAIFKSSPVNLNLSDIKFGISKSASVFLLETYLDFYDIVIFVTDKFEDFYKTVLHKCFSLSRDNLIHLSEEQLAEQNIKQLLSRYNEQIDYLNQKLSSTKQIPIFLRTLFIEELDKICLELVKIDLHVPEDVSLQDPLVVIHEVEKKLEYISCIEKLLEMNNKSNNIMENYKIRMNNLKVELKNVLYGISREIDFRQNLSWKIGCIPDIEDSLIEFDDMYLFASTHEELLRIQKLLEFYLNVYDYVLDEISKRPLFKRSCERKIHMITDIRSKIILKIENVTKKVEDRNRRVLFRFIPARVKGILISLMFTAGLTGFCYLNGKSQLYVATGVMLLFAVTSWRSTYVHRECKRLRHRYLQGRLFRNQIKINKFSKILASDDWMYRK